MNKADFSTQMQRLGNRYTKSNFPTPYPPEVQKIIWGLVAPLSEFQWRATIDSLMANNYYPPMLDKIRLLVDPMLDRIRENEKERERNEAIQGIKFLGDNAKLGSEISKFVRGMERGAIEDRECERENEA